MADVESGAGNDVAANAAGEETSLEELQVQLAEMEAAQTELADRLQLQSESQLDHRLAVIEEQFRSSFDDRLRAGSGTSSGPSSVSARVTTSRSLGQTKPDEDLLLVNRVLREVSRLMADEWRPVFEGLTAGLSKDVVKNELEALEQQPTLIQGYRSLLVWKELSAEQFDIRLLIDVLRKSNMEDIAETATALLEKREMKSDNNNKSSKPVQRRKSDVTRPKSNLLDNRRILLLAKKVGSDWEPLGKILGVSAEEIAEIKEGPDGASYHGAFKMLWAWRQAQPAHEEEASFETLRNALQQVNKGQLLELFS